jgi:hypothetical protein
MSIFEHHELFQSFEVGQLGVSSTKRKLCSWTSCIKTSVLRLSQVLVFKKKNLSQVNWTK